MTYRFQRVERKYVQITDRDLAIVEAVFRARYLTNRQIARLFFSEGAFSSCKKRIRYLFDKGYLKKRPAFPNEPDIYYLGLKGKRYIASLGEYTKEAIDRIAGVSGGEAEEPFLMMRHELSLSQLYVNATLECRRHGWQLYWENSRMLELRRLGVQPDAFLRVGERAAFLEFTAALPTREEMARKMAGYERLLEEVEGRAVVLWLTTSGAKMGQLWQGISKSLYPDYFLLGLIEEAGEFLTRPIWRWCRAEGKVAFLTPQPEDLLGAGGWVSANAPSLPSKERG
ncbi:MAG: replication-relaxation family protein [Chloroflexi bacterium]|nr:replication-relaxation family protein [Chloroflexota bacterium]